MLFEMADASFFRMWPSSHTTMSGPDHKADIIQACVRVTRILPTLRGQRSETVICSVELANVNKCQPISSSTTFSVHIGNVVLEQVKTNFMLTFEDLQPLNRTIYITEGTPSLQLLCDVGTLSMKAVCTPSSSNYISTAVCYKTLMNL